MALQDAAVTRPVPLDANRSIYAARRGTLGCVDGVDSIDSVDKLWQVRTYLPGLYRMGNTNDTPCLRENLRFVCRV